MAHEQPNFENVADNSLLQILTWQTRLETFDLSAYSAEPPVIRTQALDYRRPLDFELPAEPRWREPSVTPDEPFDSQQVEFDPESFRSMASAAWQIAKPFGRLAANRVVPELPEGVEPKAKPEPLVGDQDVPLAQKLGLPEGQIIPDSLKVAGAKTLDAVTSAKPISVSAAAVATAIVLSATPNLSTASKTAKPPAASALPAPEAAPIIKLASANVTYTPSQPTHIKAIALDLHMPVSELLAANPSLNLKAEIPAGTVVNGQISVSQLPLAKPVAVAELAERYGATSDAIASVNSVDDNGVIHDLANIPGRQIITVDTAKPVDQAAVAEHLGLGESGSRELDRVNASAPVGQLVVPMFESVQPQLTQPDQVAAVAVGEAKPAPVVTTTIPEQQPAETSDPAETSSTTPSSTSTTVAPSPPTTEPVAEAPAPAPPPPPQLVQRPASSAEKMAADVEAIHQALDTAFKTGDMGALNHLVTYSPLFTGFELSQAQRDAGMRHLPPANLLNIPGLNYEFSPNTPDNERVANSYAISTFLFTAWTFRQEIQANPVWAAFYPDACIKGGDFTARDGHATHDRGINFDMNSVMHCDIDHGHAAADGPVEWVNRSLTISHRVDNPHFNAELDKILLDHILGLHVGDNLVVTTILYNGPSPNGRVKPFANHGDHQHFKVIGPQDTTIQNEAVGGGRPELNLDQLRGQVLWVYEQGGGVEGLSQQLIITEPAPSNPVVAAPATPSVTSLPPTPTTPPVDALPSQVPTQPAAVPALPTPALAETTLPAEPTAGQKYQLGMAMLLNEIASGEGGYDSVNRHRAGDTQVNDGHYKQVFGDRSLSQHTVGELLALQRQHRILAIGRYQFIPGTFASAVEATGLSHDQVFDATTQDTLATNYLIFMKRPELSAFLRGEAPDSAVYKAVNDLCREFASMPCSDGTGNYDGDHAGNRAQGGRARVAHIRQILEVIRDAYPAALDELKAAMASQASK